MNESGVVEDDIPENPADDSEEPHQEEEASEESNLVVHARRELELLGEDAKTVDSYLRVIQAFADMGHSGYSAAIATQVLNDLFKFNNLRPLTADPKEWYECAESLWQNIRNGEAFSEDGGKTYTLVDDNGTPKKLYTSQEYNAPESTEEEPHPED